MYLLYASKEVLILRINFVIVIVTSGVHKCVVCYLISSILINTQTNEVKSSKAIITNLFSNVSYIYLINTHNGIY